ncbi:MAG: zinc protease [Verrucomicrobiota bacterium]
MNLGTHHGAPLTKAGQSLRVLLSVALSAAAVFAATTPSPSKRQPFPQQSSDLKPDPAAHFGTLANGLRYVVRPNPEPKGRASLRLLVLAGSLHEAEDQRGLAHFLEHMAFNGSVHYPPGTLVEFFQRMGMRFGGDANANTNFDRTVYLLELAHSDDATIKEGLRVLSDDAGGLLLGEEEIKKERGVILSEKRARDSVGYRSFVARFEATLGTTLLPRRLPIGLPEVITNAKRERFTDFWNTWYRPERMAVVAVGDFPDAAAVEKMIATAFTELTARAPAGPEPSLGELAKFDGVRPFFHPEPEAPVTDVSLTSVSPYKHEADTAERRVKRLPRSLALAMLNRRFEILAKQENAPINSAHANVSELFDFVRDATVEVDCKAEQWRAALAFEEQQLRRAIDQGFTPAELAEAVATLRNELDQAAKTAPTRHSNRLADEIAHSLAAREVFTTPADELALLKPALEKITPADCLRALKDAFPSAGIFVMVTGNAKISGDASAAIAAAYKEAHAIATAAPEANKESTWAYTDFGASGEIAKREHIADLDLELVTFKNGVRLNLKKTDFEAGRISASARVGNGSITQPADQRGLNQFGALAFSEAGLGKHSTDDVRRLFAGKNVKWQFDPQGDAFRFNGETTREELGLELQFLTAQLSDPGYRPEALREARKRLEHLYSMFKHTVYGPLATELPSLLADGDGRFGLPAQEITMARNLDELKAWLTPQLSHGALEVALVGDLDIEASITAAAKTIGALPAREAKPALTELKTVKFPSRPFAKNYGIESEIPKASVRLYWPTDDALDARRNRRLHLLAAILTDRLRVKVREEIGGSYSPQAENNGSDAFPGYGYMVASIDVAPATAEKISGLVVDLADELAQKGVTDDQLERARQPLLTAYKESLRSNNYWLSVLSNAQEKPQVLDWARTRFADVSAITTTEISALAKKYLGRDRVSRATISPEAKPTQP